MSDARNDGDALARRYRASLAEKAGDLSRAWDRWLVEPEDGAARGEVRLIAHRLAGSAGAYGYPDIGRHALVVDEALSDWESAAPELRAPVTMLREVLEGPFGLLLRALARAAREPDGAAPAPAAGTGAGPIVLYVDDDPDQGAWWRDVLTAEGLRVRVVEDPAEVAEAVVVERPDVLLVDYWLGEESSADLVRALRSRESASRLPIVCFTVDDGPAARNAAMSAGFTAVVRKSVRPGDLARLLREVAGGGRTR